VIRDVAWLLLHKLFVNCTKLVLSTVPQLAFIWVIGKMCLWMYVMLDRLVVSNFIIFILNRGSRARISGCNIVRNGFGSKRRPPSSTDDQVDQLPVVPSGHSGMCVYM